MAELCIVLTYEKESSPVNTRPPTFVPRSGVLAISNKCKHGKTKSILQRMQKLKSM